MDSQLKKDVASLTGKSEKEQYSMINEITKKAIANAYIPKEILEYLNSSSLNDKIDKIVYVNLVNIKKSHELVIKLLQRGDDQLISDIMRKCQFFLSDSKYTPEFYIKEIFPKISYTNRNSLLKRVGELSTPEKCVDFYKILEKIYNIKTAEIFLPYCSESFILEKLQLGIALSQRDLLTLYKKDSRKALHYLQEYSNIQNNKDLNVPLSNISQYSDVIRLLMPIFTNEIMQLIDIEKKSLIKLKIGRRASKRLIKSDFKALILSNSQYYNKLLKKSQLHRYLKSDDFEQFYMGLWPKTKDKFDPRLDYGLVKDHLNYYRTTEQQLEILLKLYSYCYAKDLLSDLKNISPNIMKLLPVADRIKYTNEKIKAEGDNYLSPIKWTKFLTTDLSIQKFKDEIYVTPDSKKRMSLIELMIESCAINNDYKALQQFLEYFNRRHRNDRMESRLTVFSTIHNNFDLDRFDGEIWNEITKVTDIISLNDEFGFFFYQKNLFIKPVEFALKMNTDLDQPLTYYIKWVKGLKSHRDYFKGIFKENAKWEKLCILKSGELFPKIFEATYHYFRTFVLSYFYWICEWNKDHPDDMLTIVDYKWAVDELEIFVSDAKASQLLKQFRNELPWDKKAEELFGNRVKQTKEFSVSNLKELLKNNNVELIREHRKEIAEKCLQTNYFFRYIQPNYKRLSQIEGILEAMKDFCKNILVDPENWLGADALRFLVKLNWMTSKEFFEFSRQYYPVERHAKVGDKRNEKLYKLQTSIVYCLRYYKTDEEVLKVIKVFLQGDYLRIAIGTLYNICTKLPCEKITKILAKWVDVPVSFKRHIIRLICLVSDRQNVMSFLRDLWLSEKNPSIRQILIKLTLDEFLNEKDGMCDFIWECIQSLTIKDKYTLDNLCSQMHSIPKAIKSEYLKNCWLAVCKIGFEDAEVRRKQLTFLNAINNSVQLMDMVFIEKLLNDNLFKLNVEYGDTFADISVSYIFNGATKEEQQRRFDFVAEKLKIAVEQDWNTAKKADEDLIYPIRNLVEHFCEEYFTMAIDSKIETVLDLVNNLDMILLELFKDPEIHIYKLYWKFNFLKMFLKSNKNFEEFGKQLTFVIQNYCMKSALILLTNFLSILSIFIDIVSNSNENKFKIVQGLLMEPISEGCALIVLKLINKSSVREKEHTKIMETLKTLNNRLVNIELNEAQ